MYFALGMGETVPCQITVPTSAMPEVTDSVQMNPIFDVFDESSNTTDSGGYTIDPCKTADMIGPDDENKFRVNTPKWFFKNLNFSCGKVFNNTWFALNKLDIYFLL